MRELIFVRPVTDTERKRLAAGLRSPDAFVLRRCQVLLASARGEAAPRIARGLGCSKQTVLGVINAFNRGGLAVLARGSKRPKAVAAAFDAAGRERLRELLHRSPRDFGKPTGLWTVELAAEAAFETGLTATRVIGVR
jgi:transposase